MTTYKLKHNRYFSYTASPKRIEHYVMPASISKEINVSYRNNLPEKEIYLRNLNSKLIASKAQKHKLIKAKLAYYAKKATTADTLDSQIYSIRREIARLKKEAQVMQSSSITIQKLVRGYLVRKTYEEVLII